jgi:hypothetical protein
MFAIFCHLDKILFEVYLNNQPGFVRNVYTVCFIENERTLAELRGQLQAVLNTERSRMIEENRVNIDTLREEHTTRVTDLRHDYRAEVRTLSIGNNG